MPLIGFDHEGVDMTDRRNWRTRSGLHVVLGGDHIQIDAGQEFRLQCLENGITQVDAFILTHVHADHVLGMDDLRRFCSLREAAIPVYARADGMQRVRDVFPYAVAEKPMRSGYAAFALQEMPAALEFPGGRVKAVNLPHGNVETLGLVFEEASTGKRLVYYTDCKKVPPEAMDLARGADVVILDALYYKEHNTHMTIDEAVAVAQELGAPITYLTHFAYPVDHATLENSLPECIHPAYDGLRLILE